MIAGARSKIITMKKKLPLQQKKKKKINERVTILSEMPLSQTGASETMHFLSSYSHSLIIIITHKKKINLYALLFVAILRSHTDAFTVISTETGRYPLQVRQTFMIS